MENLNRDKLSDRDTEKSESESGFGQKIGQSESWRSEPKQESKKEEVDNPTCEGCYY